MLVYPKTELFNLHVHAEAEKAGHQGYIPAEQCETIKVAHPVSLYQPGPVAQAGLGLLTIVILLLSAGLMVLLFQLYNSISGFMVFYGLLCYCMLEIMARKKHFNSGVDNILLFTAAWLIIGGIGTSINIGPGNSFEIVISIITFLVCSFLCLRFTDASMGMVAVFAFLSLVFFLILKLRPIYFQIFPFVLIIASLFIYVSTLILSKAPKAFYYQNTLKWIGILALLTLYASGNYHVVVLIYQQVMLTTNSVHAFPSPTFLWIWTLALPLMYVAAGISRKDRIIIRVGLILVAAAVITFLHYFPILTPEVFMLFAGLFTIVMSYGLMKYLRAPRFGFSFVDSVDDKEAGANLEAVIVGEAFGNTQTVQSDTTFGGGSFGGAGAGERF